MHVSASEARSAVVAAEPESEPLLQPDLEPTANTIEDNDDNFIIPEGNRKSLFTAPLTALQYCCPGV